MLKSMPLSKKLKLKPPVDKNLYIIAGCNGAGKTTASMTVLPEVLTIRLQSLTQKLYSWGLL